MYILFFIFIHGSQSLFEQKTIEHENALPSGEGVEVFQFSIVLLSFIYESRRMSRNNYDTPKIYLGVLIAKALV